MKIAKGMHSRIIDRHRQWIITPRNCWISSKTCIKEIIHWEMCLKMRIFKDNLMNKYIIMHSKKRDSISETTPVIRII